MFWRRKWQSSPVFLPGEPHGQGSLVGYSLWGHQESDVTEQVSTTQDEFLETDALLMSFFSDYKTLNQ